MTNLAEAIYSLYEQDSSTVARRHLPTASSGLASICSRYAWYEANSPRASTINTLLRRRMEYGNIHEDHIRDEIRKLQERGGWELKGAGMRLSLWGVAGRVDLLVKENLRWKLLEVKTMNPEDFHLFQAEGLVAFPRYYEQFMFYLAACEKLPFKEEDEISAGVLLAENTWPLGELHAQELDLDHTCVEQMRENMEHLRELIPLPDPPPRSFPYDSKRCKYCWRKAECWNVRQEERSISALSLGEEEAREVVRLVTEYLRFRDASQEADEKQSDVKKRLREIMDIHQVTEIHVPVAQDLSFHVTLKQVSVEEHVVRSYSFPRLEVR